jgi:hypothetical protein
MLSPCTLPDLSEPGAVLVAVKDARCAPRKGAVAYGHP